MALDPSLILARCAAEGCDDSVPPERAFCYMHWKQLAPDLQRAIKGAEAGGYPYATNSAYRRAVELAMDDLARKDGRRADHV